MMPQAEELLEYVKAEIAYLDKKVLDGSCGGGDTMQGQMVNYRAAVMLRRALLRLRDNVQKVLDAEAPDESGLMEMDESGKETVDG